MAWGNGFTVNQTLIRQYNLSDPSGFFEDITAVPTLANRTILSVHVYGPNITVSPATPATLWMHHYTLIGDTMETSRPARDSQDKCSTEERLRVHTEHVDNCMPRAALQGRSGWEAA
jgi:hypothetical protein